VANSETEFDENDGEDVLQDFLDELIEAEHDDDWTPTEKADTPNEAKEVVKSPKKQNREEKSRVAKPRKRKNGKFSDGFKTVQIADNGKCLFINCSKAFVLGRDRVQYYAINVVQVFLTRAR